MHTAHPPLTFDSEVVLEVQQQISGGHRAPSEEMLGHASALETVGCSVVCEDVHEEFSAWFQGARAFREQLSSGIL
jgi:hypothetical protein